MRNTMASSYYSKVRPTQNKGVTFLSLFGTWTLVLFPHAGAQPEIFQGRGGFVELGQFDKDLVKNTKKKARKETLKIYVLDTVKTTFRMKKLTQRWTQSCLFSPKISALFSIFKKVFPLFPLVAHLPCLDEAKVSTVNSD